MSVPRIALLFEFATLNGGERSMLAVLDALNKQPLRFEFVAIGPPAGRLANALRDRDIPLVGWSTQAADGQRFSTELIESSLREIVDAVQPQLLHANSLAMGRLTGRCFANEKMPVTAHLRDIIKLSGAAVSDLNQNRRLVAVSAATKAFHVAQGFDASRVCVVHNGIELEQFRPRPRTGGLLREICKRRREKALVSRVASSALLPVDLLNQIPKRSDINDTSITATSPELRPCLIATIGQIGLRKGQDVLAAAAPDVIKRFSNAQFVLIGERTSQKEESVLFEQGIQQAFDKAGLSDHLHFLGNREDVPFIMNEIDLLVHPAQQEPFGRVLLEASASGTAIIATNVGGTSEIVLDGTTGLLVAARDASALSSAIIRLLSDPSEAQALADAARKRAVTEFSIEIAAHKLANVWDEVLTLSNQ